MVFRFYGTPSFIPPPLLSIFFPQFQVNCDGEQINIACLEVATMLWGLHEQAQNSHEWTFVRCSLEWLKLLQVPRQHASNFFLIGSANEWPWSRLVYVRIPAKTFQQSQSHSEEWCITRSEYLHRTTCTQHGAVYLHTARDLEILSPHLFYLGECI